MIIIASCARQAKNILTKTNFSYHMEDIMRRSHSEKKLTIYAPLNHLYTDKFFKSPFNERKFMFLFLEQVKINTNNSQIFDRYFQAAIDNLDKFKKFPSIVTILGIAFQIRLSDKKNCKLLAQKGFELLRQNRDSNLLKTHSYNVCRFLIALNRLVGLQQFPNQYYEQIIIEKLKPLFVTYILQLFWQANLQHIYPVTKNLVKTLKQNEQMIPFSDVHHMIKAKKVIKDPTFIQITDNLQQKIGKRLASNQTGQVNQNKLDSEVVSVLFDSYFNDLKKKYL